MTVELIYLSVIRVLNTLLVLLAILSIPLYFLPTFIAIKRENFKSIFALNLFLGWTFFGWIGSLVWALKAEKIKATTKTI